MSKSEAKSYAEQAWGRTKPYIEPLAPITYVDDLPLAPLDEVHEAVDHPIHYGGDDTYETIKVIEAWGLGFSLGNCVKYISRAGKKDKGKELEDLRKAAWYLQRRINQIVFEGE